MKLRDFLGQAIKECEHQIFVLNYQLKIDEGYVVSPEADPSEITYFQCQIELNHLELEYLRRRLGVLRKWRGAAED